VKLTRYQKLILSELLTGGKTAQELIKSLYGPGAYFEKYGVFKAHLSLLRGKLREEGIEIKFTKPYSVKTDDRPHNHDKLKLYSLPPDAVKKLLAMSV